MPNIPDARGRILEAAIKIFAEKSFAGARIDEIARLAKVPKSLIYYHFKSKEDILKVMVNEFMVLLKQRLETAISNAPRDNENPQTLSHKFENYYQGFLMENKELLRIIMIESLKNNTEIPSIFIAVEEMINKESEEAIKAASYNRHERLIAEFFTSLLPIYSFFCFQDKWCDYFQIEPQEANRLFMDLYSKTHGAYHKILKSEEEVDNG